MRDIDNIRIHNGICTATFGVNGVWKVYVG